MAICIAQCKNGRACQFPTMAGSTRCFNHDDSPEIVERRRKGRARGGVHRKFVPTFLRPGKLDSVEEIRDLSFRIVREMRDGLMDIKSGNALSYACRTALRAAELAEQSKAFDMPPFDFEIRSLKKLAESCEAPSIRLRATERLLELSGWRHAKKTAY